MDNNNKKYEKDKVYEIASKYNIIIADEFDKVYVNEKPDKKKNTGGNILLILFALPWILSGALFFFSGMSNICYFVRSKIICTELVQGEVSDIKQIVSEGRNRTIRYKPVFSYSFNNEEYTYEARSSSHKKEPELGKKVDIYVAPDSPDTVYIPEYKTERKNAVSSLILGGSIITVILLLYFKIRNS
ncbi:MAG: hypothetical protein BWZ04_01843 [Firmicutes bacterium ADurb.BinA205]|nr:MAG: hypothetical protein BWZ04_01843 [Firmicutes bacterium ADurb.BinA205]